MPKPKFVKPLLIGVACTIPVGLVVGLSVNWDHTQFISAVGSSGVKPFIESFGSAYHDSHKKFDVTVESGGSAFAVEEMSKGYTTLGNTSNNPYLIVNNEGFRNKWKDKKTLTLGWEGLVIMYSLPKGLTKTTQENFKIVISKDNILSLYGVFSGFHELKNGTWDPVMDSLWYYAPQEVQQSITDVDDIKLLKETQILPFVRAGGNSGANSSIAFSYYSNLTEHEYMEDMTKKQQDAFAYGQYGHDGLTLMQTDESNARAWQSFVYNDKGSSMTYLTTSFIANENNRKEINKRGYKIAEYLPRDSSTPVAIDGTRESLEKIDSDSGYNWYRPINVMIDLNLQKAKDFIYWIYIDSDEDIPLESITDPLSKHYKDIVYSKGAKPLNFDEMKSMFKDGYDTDIDTLKTALFDLAASDLSLESTRPSLFKDVYGAYDLWL